MDRFGADLPFSSSHVLQGYEHGHTEVGGTPAPIQQRNPEFAVSPSLRPQISRQQWEELKPLIHRLYIEENKTLVYIANALAESHNFRPT
jgi:hypothetical protein